RLPFVIHLPASAPTCERLSLPAIPRCAIHATGSYPHSIGAGNRNGRDTTGSQSPEETAAFPQRFRWETAALPPVSAPDVAACDPESSPRQSGRRTAASNVATRAREENLAYIHAAASADR